MLMEIMDVLNFDWWVKTHIVDECKFDDNGNIIMKNNTNYKSILTPYFVWNNISISKYFISIQINPQF